MQKIHLTKINLINYRNFEHFSQEFDSNLVLITGNNGSGKTNILEAISYLSPGRGIRGAKKDEICRDDIHNWQADIELQSKLGIANVSCKYNLENKKNYLQYNGSKISANDLSNLANIIWLTPQMNGIFTDSRANRLRFFDRISFGFYINHAKNINKLDHFHKERLVHLTNNIGNFDIAWLSVLEKQIADQAKKIHDAREGAILYMQNSINKLDTRFPKALISLTKLLDDKDYLEVYAEKLKQNREKDAYSGRTNFGVHKIDFNVIHTENNKNASMCSTGQQKAMLISIFLAQVEAIISESSATPILLMDELFVHLDDLRKQYLSEYVINRGVQVFITATDIHGIEDIATHSQRVILEGDLNSS